MTRLALVFNVIWQSVNVHRTEAEMQSHVIVEDRVTQELDYMHKLDYTMPMHLQIDQ